MRGLDSELVQVNLRKVVQVGSDKDVGAALDGHGEDMTVIGVGELEFCDALAVAGHQAVEDRGVHETPGPRQLLERNPFAFRQVAHPFVLDLVRPFGLEEIGQGQTDQEVAQVEWVKNVGVIEGDCDSHVQRSNLYSRFRCWPSAASSPTSLRRSASLRRLNSSRSARLIRRWFPSVVTHGIMP